MERDIRDALYDADLFGFAFVIGVILGLLLFLTSKGASGRTKRSTL